MQTVTAYKTSDGEIFDDRGDAEIHETKIKIKGILQSNIRANTFTPADIADIFLKDMDKFSLAIMEFKRVMKKLEKQKSAA